MDKFEKITVKIRKATTEDFRVYRSSGSKQTTHFKIAFPFFRKKEGGFSLDITKHVQVQDFEIYVNELKKEIGLGLIYVLDPYFLDSSSSDDPTAELLTE